MKTPYPLICVSALILLMIAACTLNVENTTDELITKQDLQAATQIIGGAASSDESGVVLSISDALHIIEQNKFKKFKVGPPIEKQSDRSGRGREENYRHRYNDSTGTHLVTFIRFYSSAFFKKEITDSLSYKYKDQAGYAIEFPEERRDDIASVLFYGQRSGKITTLNEVAYFRRKDTLLVTGIGSGSSDLLIEGKHQQSGYRSRLTPLGEKKTHPYDLKIKILRLKAPQKAFGLKDEIYPLLQGVLSFRLSLNGKENSDQPLVISGNLQLNGDGTALLSIKGRSERFQINLKNGDSFNIDKAFKGRIRGVDVAEKSITLQNGLKVRLHNSAILKDSLFSNFQTLKDSLQAGAVIFGSGSGKLHDGYFEASSVDIITNQGLDNTQNNISFNARITSVNLDAHSFTLSKRAVILTGKQTKFSKKGTYTSLKEVAEALKKGTFIYAKGKARKISAYRGDAAARNVTFVRIKK